MLNANDLTEIVGAYNVKIGLREASEHSIPVQEKAIQPESAVKGERKAGIVAKYQEAIRLQREAEAKRQKRNIILIAVAAAAFLAVLFGSRLLVR